MDVLDGLEFPTASFDLVNLRSGVSFLRTWDWTKLLGELLRVTRPGGVIRITEGEVVSQSNSSALMRLCEMLQDAFYQAGHLFTRESTGLTAHLTQLLDRCGCERVQTKAHAMEYQAGTPEGETYCEDMMLAFQTLRPFIQKWGSVGRDYDTIYRQAMAEMHQPDFVTTFKMLTVWGSKPEPKLKELQQ
jgi:SAM-dependent methyltransferase